MNSENELTDYMGFQGLLDDEEILVRQTAREFVNKEVLPIIDGYAQKEEFSAHLVKLMGQLGFLVMYPIFAFGREAQKDLWLPLLAQGKAIGCFGLTEPDFGSNPAKGKRS